MVWEYSHEHEELPEQSKKNKGYLVKGYQFSSSRQEYRQEPQTYKHKTQTKNQYLPRFILIYNQSIWVTDWHGQHGTCWNMKSGQEISKLYNVFENISSKLDNRNISPFVPDAHAAFWSLSVLREVMRFLLYLSETNWIISLLTSSRPILNRDRQTANRLA